MFCISARIFLDYFKFIDDEAKYFLSNFKPKIKFDKRFCIGKGDNPWSKTVNSGKVDELFQFLAHLSQRLIRELIV